MATPADEAVDVFLKKRIGALKQSLITKGNPLKAVP